VGFTCSVRGGREETNNFVETVEALDRQCRLAELAFLEMAG